MPKLLLLFTIITKLFLLSSFKSTCEVNEFCLECDKENELCEKCKDEYYPDENGGCSETLNCTKSVNGTCTMCSKGNYLNLKNNQCYSNEEEGELYKCTLVNKDGETCVICEENYFLGYLDNKCSSVYGCAKSESPDKCLECEENLCKNLKTKTCEDSDEGISGICYRCEETNEEGTACKVCKGNYTLSSSGFCTDYSHCVKEKDGKCIECEQDYFHDGLLRSYCLNKNFGCIEEVVNGCLKCDDERDFYNCTTCLDGFYLDKTFYFCYECQKGCATCSNYNDCGSCSEGYYLIKQPTSPNSFDAECEKCMKGCKVCDDDITCKECLPGYYLTNEKSEYGNLECAPCSEGCLECLDETYCVKCDEYYELSPVENKILCQINN